ncbi:hypothetical protein TNCV_2018651 [Trichonephila clavipes]|nr:hypothetical protein TNCV_2018651 [Trichonephila clavipes]
MQKNRFVEDSTKLMALAKIDLRGWKFTGEAISLKDPKPTPVLGLLWEKTCFSVIGLSSKKDRDKQRNGNLLQQIEKGKRKELYPTKFKVQGIFVSASNPFDLDGIMAAANDKDLTQNGIINNVHIPSSPSRFVITVEFINDNQQSYRIGKHSHRPSCRQGKDELTTVPVPHIYRGPHQESGRATRPSNSCGLYSKRDTTLNTPSNKTEKRLIDDDGFQTPGKRHSAKKIDHKNPSLPPTTSQTSNPAQAPPPPAESSDSEIEDEDAGKSNPTAVGTP